LQGKECSWKGPTIRIRVNLQGMDLSRNGISKEQYLQGTELARNGISKERWWTRRKALRRCLKTDSVLDVTL